MGRVIYVPENNKIWLDLYLSQAQQKGHGGFQGIPYQRGYGLGSFFGRLFRSILPIAKSVGKSALKTVGKEAINMGLNVANDVVKGRKVKKSLKKHGLKASKNLLNKAQQKFNQSGKGLGKRAVGSKKTCVPIKKRKKSKKPVDIFS